MWPAATECLIWEIVLTWGRVEATWKTRTEVLTVYTNTYPHMAVSWEVTANVQSGLFSFKYTILEEKPYKWIIFTWVNNQFIPDFSLNTSVDLINFRAWGVIQTVFENMKNSSILDTIFSNANLSLEKEMSAFFKRVWLLMLPLLIFPPIVDMHSKNIHKAMCSSNNYLYIQLIDRYGT